MHCLHQKSLWHKDHRAQSLRSHSFDLKLVSFYSSLKILLLFIALSIILLKAINDWHGNCIVYVYVKHLDFPPKRSEIQFHANA